MALFDSKTKNINAYTKSIEEKRAAINRYYDEIGRFYYNQYKDINVDNTKDINTRCEAITRLTKDIEELNVKILFERGLKLCPSCKQENDLKHAFCFKCGSQFDAASSTAPAVVESVAAAPVVEATSVVETSASEEKTEDKTEA